MFNTEIRTTVQERSKQLVFFVREFKKNCELMVEAIDDPSGIRAVRLVQLQNSCSQIKDKLQSWPYGSLTDLDVRTELASQFPNDYANAGAVNSELNALNTLFNELTTEVETLLVAARQNGQFYNADPITGFETYMLITAPDTNAVRAKAAEIVSSIN